MAKRFAWFARVASLAVLGIVALSLLWPRAAWAQAPEQDLTISLEAPRALWSDGDQLLLGGSRGAIGLFGSDGQLEAREPVAVDEFVDADGTRAAGGLLAVFAAADGRLIVWRPGSVSEERVPLRVGVELVAVVVDARGTSYAVGHVRAL
jgi:hypothetical protein